MSFKKFKVLTFDVVGTLIDFERGVLEAVRAIGGEAARKLTEEQIYAPYLRGRDLNYGRSSTAFFHVYKHMAKELDLPASDEAADAFQMSVLRWPAFPDSAEALERLRRRFRLVAMTNADRSAFSFYSHTLGNPFHDSVTMDEAECGKPDPLFFAYTRGRLAALGYKKEEILHVAQSQYNDIGVAKALGYTACWIERRQGLKGFGATPPVEKITKPDHHFSTLGALADAIDAELGR
jgi:putative hydrolase of the HAD superfamily